MVLEGQGGMIQDLEIHRQAYQRFDFHHFLIVQSRNIGETAVAYESSLTILPSFRSSTISLVGHGREVLTEVPPELRKDRLWVPVRALAEALG